MRLTSVDMYGPDFSEAITFNLRDAQSDDRYQVRDILGLDTEDIIPKFYGFSLKTQSRMYEMILKPRDIVIRVGLNPNFRVDESYSSVRDELYKAISATRTGAVTLYFKSGATLVAIIKGFITKFEVPHFVKAPEVTITVNCSDPMFRAINPAIFAPADLPVANPVLIPDSLSTAPHGFAFQVTFTSPEDSFTIQDVVADPEWKFVITPYGGFLADDVLYFSSEYLNKYLYLIRDGDTYHLMDVVSPSSIWPILFPGENSFYFSNIASIDWNSLQHYAAYWGV